MTEKANIADVLDQMRKSQRRFMLWWRVVNVIFSALFLVAFPLAAGWAFVHILRGALLLTLPGAPLSLLERALLAVDYYVIGVVAAAGLVFAVVGAWSIIRTTFRQTMPPK